MSRLCRHLHTNNAITQTCIKTWRRSDSDSKKYRDLISFAKIRVCESWKKNRTFARTGSWRHVDATLGEIRWINRFSLIYLGISFIGAIWQDSPSVRGWKIHESAASALNFHPSPQKSIRHNYRFIDAVCDILYIL